MTTLDVKANSLAKHVFKKSTLAMCVAAFTAQAYAQPNTSTTEPTALEEVVIFGVRQSLQNAQDIKREANTVKDVITSSDIGALPDKSVVEALQRVPGVAIERFESSADPDHFTVEGGNVTVRGLNRVRSEFNGRDAFSAGADGGLNFSDIPPELVGSVEVAKNQTADMTEGGVAGTINLVTRKPFDSDELVLGATVRASYGDLVDEVTPAVSLIGSNVWESDIGRFGALLSLSASEFTSRGDGVGVFNYYERNFDGADVAGPTIVPLAGSARQQSNDRDRLGFAGSLQWENPSETVLTTLEFIRSDSSLSWTEQFIEYPNQPFSAEAGTSLDSMGLTDYSFDCPESPSSTTPCQFQSGTIIGGDYPWGATPYLAGARAREDERVINDLSLNVQYMPTDRLTVWADVQYINATNDIVDNTAHGKFFSDAYLSVGGSEPEFELVDDSVSQAESYFFRSAMDHISENEGDARSFQLDGEYLFDDSWVTGVKAGVRVSNKEVTVREADYNWGNLSESWVDLNAEGNNVGGEPFFDQFVDQNLVESYTFDDHLNGTSLQSNSTFWFPSQALLSMTAEEMHATFESNDIIDNTGGDAWVPNSRRDGVIEGTPFLPSEIYVTEEDRQAVYAMMDFGDENADMPWSGNVGLRYVTWQISSTGADNFPNRPSEELLEEGLDPSIPQDAVDYSNGAGGATYTIEGEDFSRLFPSFNVKLGLTDDLILRFAASESMWMPTLLDVRNRRNIDISTSAIREEPAEGEEQGELTGAVFEGFFANNAGNPYLQPEVATNLDLALEWYYADVGSLTGTLFHKRIRDFHRSATSTVEVTNPTAGITQPVAVTSTQNAGEATVQGFEIAAQTTFEALGDAFAPFGIQASYTYIDGEEESSALAEPVGDEFSFRNFNNLPIEGLSRENYNLVVFYDDEDFQARLAYSWRSRYLLNSRDEIAFSPVYGEATGQLDGSISYQVTDTIKVGLEANNLTNEITRTSIQYNQEGVLTPRSYFANDRRFALFLQAAY